jgi:hypothetical protein
MNDDVPLLELDVQLAFKDYVLFVYYDSLLKMWWLIPFFLLGYSISAILLAVSIARQDAYLLRDIVPFTSLLILGGIFVFAGPYFSSHRDFAVNPALRLPIHYVVRETYLQSTSPRRTGRLPWDKVSLARETGSSFLIQTNDGGTLILPKKSFQSESQMMSLRELLIVILGLPRCRFRLDWISERF